MSSIKCPKVGLGVLIFNNNNQILLGQRINSHGNGHYGPPGGHLEFGESFENCAIREVKEETGLDIKSPKFLTVTNDVFYDEDKHYISIFMSTMFPGTHKIINMEPHKTISWNWFDVDNLPANIFLPLATLTKKYYLKNGILLEKEKCLA